jgi:hypothetical protein
MLALVAAVLLVQDQGRLVATIPDGVEVYAVRFSRFGSVASFVARKGQDHWAVLGEWRSKTFHVVFDCVPSADGRTAVVLSCPEEGGRSSVIYRNDEIIESFPDVTKRSWVWGSNANCISDDGKVIVYFVLTIDGENRRYAITNTGKSGKVEPRLCLPASVSGDGKTIVYATGDDDKSWIMVNDVRGPEYDIVTLPVISRRNNVVAYGAKEEERWFLILGTKKSRVEAKGKMLLVFVNSEGSAAGYCESRVEDDGGKLKFFNRVVVDGKKGEEFSQIDGASLHQNGKTVLYRARGLDKKNYVVIGDRKLQVAEPVGDPEFSPDGKKAGYGIRKGQELRWVEVDLPN